MHLQTSEITLEIWQKILLRHSLTISLKRVLTKGTKMQAGPLSTFLWKTLKLMTFSIFFFIESLKEKYFSYELRAFFSSKYYQYVMNPSKKYPSHTKCVFTTLIVRFLHERKRKPQTRALGAKVPIRFFDNIPQTFKANA